MVKEKLIITLPFVNSVPQITARQNSQLTESQTETSSQTETTTTAIQALQKCVFRGLVPINNNLRI